MCDVAPAPAKYPFVLAEPKRTVSCGGMYHRDAGVLGRCSGCGVELVRVEKDGRNHVHPVTRGHSESGYERVRYMCWVVGHTCDLERLAMWQRARLLDLGRGALSVGAPVKVVKGRKVPVGTEGTLTWVGEGGYGLRVGLRDAEGTVHWTAASNVEVHLTGVLAEQVAAALDVAEAEAAERS